MKEEEWLEFLIKYFDGLGWQTERGPEHAFASDDGSIGIDLMALAKEIQERNNEE